jgi:hypothetical protein
MSESIFLSFKKDLKKFKGLDALFFQKLQKYGVPRSYPPRAAVLPLTTNCIDYTECRDNSGYGIVTVSLPSLYPNMSFRMRAHRISYILDTGKEIPEDLDCAHLCQENSCANPKHIITCTRSLNKRMSFLNVGVGKPYSRKEILCTKQILLIMQLGIQLNLSVKEISIATGIKYQTIRNILLGETYNLKDTKEELMEIAKQQGRI